MGPHDHYIEHFILFYFFSLYFISIFSNFTKMTTVLELVMQELSETEPADVIVEPPPYHRKDRTKKKVQEVYRILRNMARQRCSESIRMKTLVYAYYLGELLETKPKTPAQRTVLANLLTKHYEVASTRTYKIFSPHGIEAIYRTKFLNLSNIKSLHTSDLVFLF